MNIPGIRLALEDDVERTHSVLRISAVQGSNDSIQLQLEGSLVGPWVEELRRQSERALTDAKSVSLDLGKLWFADQEGVALLRELAQHQVLQFNCSTFIAQQLKETTL